MVCLPLQRRQLLHGVINPGTFGIHTEGLRDQYAEAVRMIPTTAYKAPVAIMVPRKEEAEKKDDEGDDEGGKAVKEDKEKEEVMVSQMGKDIFVEETCSICLCPFEESHDEDGVVKVLNCGHGYHPGCLDEWLFRRNVCPMCKRVAVSDLDPLANNRANPLTRARLPPHEERVLRRFNLPGALGRLGLGGLFPRAPASSNNVGEVRRAPDGIEMQDARPHPRGNRRQVSPLTTPDGTPHGTPEVTPRRPGARAAAEEKGDDDDDDDEEEEEDLDEDLDEEESLAVRGGGRRAAAATSGPMAEFQRRVSAEAQARTVGALEAGLLAEMGFALPLAKAAATRFRNIDDAVAWCLAHASFGDDNEDEYENDEDGTLSTAGTIAGTMAAAAVGAAASALTSSLSTSMSLMSSGATQVLRNEAASNGDDETEKGKEDDEEKQAGGASEAAAPVTANRYGKRDGSRDDTRDGKRSIAKGVTTAGGGSPRSSRESSESASKSADRRSRDSAESTGSSGGRNRLAARRAEQSSARASRESLESRSASRTSASKSPKSSRPASPRSSPSGGGGGGGGGEGGGGGGGGPSARSSASKSPKSPRANPNGGGGGGGGGGGSSAGSVQAGARERGALGRVTGGATANPSTRGGPPPTTPFDSAQEATL